MPSPNDPTRPLRELLRAHPEPTGEELASLCSEHPELLEYLRGQLRKGTHASEHEDTSTRTPEELFEQHLVRLERDEPSDLEELCTRYPHAAQALRKLALEWERFSEQLERLEKGHVVDAEALAEHPERAADLEVLQAILPELGASSTADEPDAAASDLTSVFRTGPGTVLGDYRLQGVVGRGGMGEVWKAEQLSLSRTVALKLVLPERISGKGLALFAREARAGGRLTHDAIVSVYGTGETEGLHWIAMEFVHGPGDLRTFLEEVRRADEPPPGYFERMADFVARLADGLEYAHKEGVTHRDLKPHNILVTPLGAPKLTDFGLAAIASEAALSKTGDFAGTYCYMSPEQVAARRIGIDHRTDIFSLGVVLYEILTLRRAFEGDTTHQIAEKILYDDPPDLRKIRSRIPRELSVICGKAIEKHRSHRYQTMGELAADLRRFLAHEPIHAKPPNALQRAGKWIRRNPVLSGAAAMVLAAFALITFLLWSNVKTNEALSAEVAAVKRLSALQDYEDLVAEANLLWPPHPRQMDAYERWIERADALVADLPLHLTRRDALRAMALPASRPQGGTPGADGEYEWKELRFPEGEGEARWWHANLTKLTASLEKLRTGLLADTETSTSVEEGWSIPRRLAFARRLRDDLSEGGPAHSSWQRAIEAVRSAPRYGGLQLVPQVGLVPIGVDPRSGLWEFWHVATGSRPERDGDGQLIVHEGTGLVLVLLPEGRYWMGATKDELATHNHDPYARVHEGPPHAVQMSAFFLSKYEMTQAQWLHFTGDNPSLYQPPMEHVESLAHPLENVSWTDCMQQLARMHLVLPSEAQWEYGCRAGSDTIWWTGSERESLRTHHAANFADLTARQAGALWKEVDDWPDYEDGWVLHAPVGTFAGNDFGLHEVHGNVWEWVLDGFSGTAYTETPERDPLVPWQDASHSNRVHRGGSFRGNCKSLRSACRSHATPTYADKIVGVRPAWTVQP